MGTVFTEGRHPGEFLLSEAPGQQSRETITVASGSGVIAPGSVLGLYSAGGSTGKWALSTDAADNGRETARAVALYGCDASAVDQKIAVIRRGAEVKAASLTYHASVNNPTALATKATQLLAAGIIVR